MSYCTIDDMRKVIPGETIVQLTDDESSGAVVEARVEEAITLADAEIDAYCAVRYAVPFDPVPAIIRKCSVDMAIYNLYGRVVEKTPETRVERYRNAVRLLEGIAGGDTGPGLAVEGAGLSGQCGTNRSPKDRTFSKSSLDAF